MAAREVKKELFGRLRGILDAKYILTTEEQLKPFECDGLSVYKALPIVAVLPGTVEEVQAIIKVCYSLRIPLVTRGAGTGLSAGAKPNPEGLLLVMTRLNKIL
ncbi:MAG: FAD-binding protein, partial [Gammaproteobacteria bacterium]|nr:FAD-binding protein [Gammaproteobacteria bacterium]